MSETTTRQPQQERSRITAERFITAAFKLLEKRRFSELTVDDLAKAARRSVGAFYQRFASKDEFLNSLIEEFLQDGVQTALRGWDGETPEAVYAAFLRDAYFKFCRNRYLWHAALERSSGQPGFWSRFSEYRSSVFASLLQAMEKTHGAAISGEESRRIAIANQLFNSVINNQIINSPGPLMLDDNNFLPTLTKIAIDVAFPSGESRAKPGRAVPHARRTNASRVTQ